MRSVSMRPGASVLTVMPSAATWSDSVLDQAVVALRTALESMSVGSGCLTDDEVLVMTRPQCLARMDGRHSRVSRMADIRLSSNAPCQSSSVRVSNMPGFGPPALLKRTSTLPNESTVVLTTCSRSAIRVTSAASPRTRVCCPAAACTCSAAAWIAGRIRENMTTFAPSAASACATPLPSPWLAAATIAVLPRSPRSIGRELTKRSAEHFLKHAEVVLVVDAGQVGLGEAASLELGSQAWQILGPEHTFERWQLRAKVGPHRRHLQDAAELAHSLDEVRADADMVDAGHLHNVLQVVNPGAQRSRVGRDEAGHRRDANHATGLGDGLQEVVGQVA